MPNVEWKGIPKAGVCQQFLCMVFYFEELVVVTFLYYYNIYILVTNLV